MVIELGATSEASLLLQATLVEESLASLKKLGSRTHASSEGELGSVFPPRTVSFHVAKTPKLMSRDPNSGVLDCDYRKIEILRLILRDSNIFMLLNGY